MIHRTTLLTLTLIVGGPAALLSLPPALAANSAPATTSADAAPQLPLLSVAQIEQRNAAARGGRAAWERVQAMSLSGRLDAGHTRIDGGRVGMATSKLGQAQAKALARKALATNGTLNPGGQLIQLPFQLDLQRPTKTRLEIPFQGDTAVQVYDGSNGWKLRPYLGRREAEPFTEQERRLAASQQPLDGALIDYAAKGTSVALEGIEAVEGHPAYKLKLTLKSGDVRHLWIDGQTFLDLKIDGSPRQWDGKSRQVATYFRDYKPVQGLLIAHRLETVLEGVPANSENIYVEKVALNPILSEDHFGRPQ